VFVDLCALRTFPLYFTLLPMGKISLKAQAVWRNAALA